MPYSIRPSEEVDLAAEFDAARSRAVVDSRNEIPRAQGAPARLLAMLAVGAVALGMVAIWLFRLRHSP